MPEMTLPLEYQIDLKREEYQTLDALLRDRMEMDASFGIKDIGKLQKTAQGIYDFFNRNSELSYSLLLRPENKPGQPGDPEPLAIKVRLQSFIWFLSKGLAREAYANLMECDINNLPKLQADAPSIRKVNDALVKAGVQKDALFVKGAFSPEQVEAQFAEGQKKSDQIGKVYEARGHFDSLTKPYNQDVNIVKTYEPQLRQCLKEAGARLTALVAEKQVPDQIIEDIIQHQVKMAHISIARGFQRQLVDVPSVNSIPSLLTRIDEHLTAAKVDYTALDTRSDKLFAEEDRRAEIRDKPKVEPVREDPTVAKIAHDAIRASLPTSGEIKASLHNREIKLSMDELQSLFRKVKSAMPVGKKSVLENLKDCTALKADFFKMLQKAEPKSLSLVDLTEKLETAEMKEFIQRHLRLLDVRFAAYALVQMKKDGFMLDETGVETLQFIANSWEASAAERKRPDLLASPQLMVLNSFSEQIDHLLEAVLAPNKTNLAHLRTQNPSPLDGQYMDILASACADLLVKTGVTAEDGKTRLEPPAIATLLLAGWKENILRAKYGIDPQTRSEAFAKSA